MNINTTIVASEFMPILFLSYGARNDCGLPDILWCQFNRQLCGVVKGTCIFAMHLLFNCVFLRLEGSINFNFNRVLFSNVKHLRYCN